MESTKLTIIGKNISIYLFLLSIFAWLFTTFIFPSTSQEYLAKVRWFFIVLAFTVVCTATQYLLCIVVIYIRESHSSIEYIVSGFVTPVISILVVSIIISAPIEVVLKIGPFICLAGVLYGLLYYLISKVWILPRITKKIS